MNSEIKYGVLMISIIVGGLYFLGYLDDGMEEKK